MCNLYRKVVLFFTVVLKVFHNYNLNNFYVKEIFRCFLSIKMYSHIVWGVYMAKFQPGHRTIRFCKKKAPQNLKTGTSFFTLLVVSVVPCCCSYGIGKKILFHHLCQSIGRRVAIFSLLYSFPWDLRQPMFHRNEVGFTPMFPQKLYWYIMMTDFFNSPDSFWNVEIYRLTVRFGGQIMKPEIVSPNCESWKVWGY